MKVFFDTNVYVAEALLGRGAQRIIDATQAARWRVYASQHVLTEVAEVLAADLGFSRRLAVLTQQRVLRRASIVEPAGGAEVPGDPDDSPILRAALACGADYLVSNDRHLLSLDPFEGLRIVTMDQYHELLQHAGLL